MPRPTHFEIPADRPDRAITFYGKVFDWQFQRWEGPIPYWMVMTGEAGPGINGGLHPRAFPGQGPVNVVDVPSCDEYVRRIEGAGGKTVVPKMAIPGIGWLAYCSDPEGNTLGLMQADPSAA
jgi:predicted enzyme related to lactoylglutathione lyase